MNFRLPSEIEQYIHREQISRFLSIIRQIIAWGIGFFFTLGALLSISYPLVALSLLLLGLIIAPIGPKLLKQKMNIGVSMLGRGAIIFVLFILSTLSIDYYEIDQKSSFGSFEDNNIKQTFIPDQKAQAEKLKIDSFAIYVQQSDSLLQKNEFERAQTSLILARPFAQSYEVEKQLDNKLWYADSCLAWSLLKAKKYEDAIPLLHGLAQKDRSDNKIALALSQCYHNIGKTEDAVHVISPFLSIDDASITKWHNKINPLRRETIGYTTLCCDGTTSSAKGRGACSHHGGVCNWNAPIYHESRKY